MEYHFFFEVKVREVVSLEVKAVQKDCSNGGSCHCAYKYTAADSKAQSSFVMNAIVSYDEAVVQSGALEEAEGDAEGLEEVLVEAVESLFDPDQLARLLACLHQNPQQNPEWVD